MRVTKQLIPITNACALSLYNKGVSRVVVPVACNANKAIEVLKKENKEKMLNYLDIPNNCVLSLSLSLSLSYSTITSFLLTIYVLMQCVARYSVSTKGLLYLPFADFVLSIIFFSYTLIGTMLTRMGKVPFASLPMHFNVVT